MTAHRHTANRETGQRGGRKTQEALARLHSARVAKSRHRAALPGAGGRQRPHPGRASSKAQIVSLASGLIQQLEKIVKTKGE